MSRRILAAVIAAAALTACSTQAATPPTQPQPAAPATVGTTQDTGNGARVTVHEIRDNISRYALPGKPGNRWVGLDAEVCVDQTSTIDDTRWQLHDTSNHIYPASIGAGDMPGADYVTGILSGGTCMRGWLSYQLPTSETITTVTYTAGNEAVLTWK